jgi:rfaE bifunctional protein nucleotidyltransferase chain/domain
MIDPDRIAGRIAPERLAASSGSPSYERKLHSAEHLVDALEALPRPRVFTNGVFDLLHRGHVTYLAQARALGGSLIVALNDDASVRRLGKGADRPINPLADRLAVVGALESVDLVTWFEGDTPIDLIRAIGPDILVKGGDWLVDAIVGAPEVLSAGGAVVSIPFCHDRSTTALLGRVRAGI